METKDAMEDSWTLDLNTLNPRDFAPNLVVVIRDFAIKMVTQYNVLATRSVC